MKLKVTAFKGKYEVYTSERLLILMRCSKCGEWVVPEELSFGKAHIYGKHCGLMQDLGCIIYHER